MKMIFEYARRNQLIKSIRNTLWIKLVNVS